MYDEQSKARGTTQRDTDGCDTDRTKRVKEARDEAKKEIEAYKKGKDEEFKKFEAEVRTYTANRCEHSIQIERFRSQLEEEYSN
jgi:hypothetical protein